MVVAEKLRAGREFDNPCRLSLIDLANFERFEQRLGGDRGATLMKALVDRARARSVDGAAVGLIAPGKLCVIHDPGTILDAVLKWLDREAREADPDNNSPLKKALLTGFHSTAKHNATKAVSPSSETMRTI